MPVSTRSRRPLAGRDGRRFIAALAAGLVAVALGPALAIPAGASPRPAAAGVAAATFLAGVSCPDQADCWAVGLDNHPDGQPVPAIERFSGGTWSAVPAPKPAGAHSAQLHGVWCVSARSCQAVGFYQVSASGSFPSFPLAERWDGTRWSLVKAPATGSANSFFNGITCTAAQDCWVVGSRAAGTFTRTLIEHWNGTTWSAVSAPSVAAYSALETVSCPQATNCWAAGFWELASGSRSGTLTEHWNGKAWSTVATPTSGASSSQLLGSSCSAASACMTVGWGPKGALAQRWNGTAWSVSLMGGPDIALRSDSCPGDRACMAVGDQSVRPQREVNIAEQWNGQTWSTLSVPSLASWPVNSLNGIACTAAANCWAVGGTGNPGAPGAGRPLIAHWNGATWALVG
jgi:hypothetical protein